MCPPSKRMSSAARNDLGKIDARVRDMFVETWFCEYDDIRWFFLREVA